MTVAANVKAQLLTVPPYAVSAMILILFSYCSDRLQTYVPGCELFTAPSYALTSLVVDCLRASLPSSLDWDTCESQPPLSIHPYLGLTQMVRLRIMLVVPNNQHARYFAVLCITSGTYTVIGLILAWCTWCLSLPSYT
jgi:hypothetical protein